jgi:hypothetical protein
MSEIEHKAQWGTPELLVSEALTDVLICDRASGVLQLKEDFSVDEEVEFKLVHLATFEGESFSRSGLNGDVGFNERLLKCVVVMMFAEAWTQSVMNTERASDNRTGQFSVQ